MASFIDRFGRWNLRRLGAQSLTLDFRGAPQNVYRLAGRGEGGDLVLLHGIGSTATAFAPLIKRLRDHFTTFWMPEAPGHGASETPADDLDIDDYFEAVCSCIKTQVLDDERRDFHLYGNSLGGATALRYAIEFPERVRSLMLLSPAGGHTTPEELEALLGSFELDNRKEAKAFARRLFHKGHWFLGAAGNDLRRRLQNPVVTHLLSAVGNAQPFDPAAVAALPMPILMMWGGAERLLPDSSRDWFLEHLPEHTQWVRPEHFAHSAYVEYPDDLAESVLGFQRSLQTESETESESESEIEIDASGSGGEPPETPSL